MKTLGLSAAEGIERARARVEAKIQGKCERPSIHKKYGNCNYEYSCYCRQLTNIDCKDLFFFSFLRIINTNFYVEI